MIQASTRHAAWLAVLIWLFAIPVAFHAIMEPVQDDCSNPDGLKLANFVPVADANALATVNRSSDGTQPLSGNLETQSRWSAEPKWVIARRHDLESSYFAPPGLLSRVSPEDRVSIVTENADGLELPIHLRVDDSQRHVNSSAYLYIFAGRPIRFPILASLQNAFPQLLGGTLPLTVLLSEGDSRPRYAEKNERILVEWIRSAWYRYQEVCGS